LLVPAVCVCICVMKLERDRERDNTGGVCMRVNACVKDRKKKRVGKCLRKS